MSRRELKALEQDWKGAVQSRLRPRGHQLMMSQHEEDSEEAEQLGGQMAIDDLQKRLQEAETLAKERQAEIAELTDVLERAKMEMELDKFKALHEQQQRYEQQIREEKNRTDSWIRGLSESSARERHQLEKMVESLSKELEEVKEQWSHHVRESVETCESEEGYNVWDGRNEVESECDESVVLPSAGGQALSREGVAQSSVREQSGASVEPSAGIAESVRECTEHVREHVSEGGRGADGVSHGLPVLAQHVSMTSASTAAPSVVLTVPTSGGSHMTSSVTPLLASRITAPFATLTSGSSGLVSTVPSASRAGGVPVSVSGPHRTDEGDVPSLVIAAGSGVPSSGVMSVSVGAPVDTFCLSGKGSLTNPMPVASGFQGANPMLAESMSKFLQAQMQMLWAQAQAVVVQGLPALKKFSGENLESEDEGFDRWIELFQERAHLAGWTEEHKLYQLKMHFEGNALQILRMVPSDEIKNYDLVIERLRKRFKPVDIEELKSVEFHQKMQGSESIEKLGLSLQKLASGAFPSTSGKEFDRLLRGRFFQAPLLKWQRKLGAPKPGETFGELYDRARTLVSRSQTLSPFFISGGGKESGPLA